MNPSSTADAAFETQRSAAPPLSEPRPLLWSIRRELWENRSLYLGPVLVTAFVLFATMIATAIRLPKIMRDVPAADAAKRLASAAYPTEMAPAPIMFATLLVGAFYCFDALYGERRDRSILFWKSLPVSDRMTVLSKASIPLVVLPVIAWSLSVITQVILLLLSMAVLVVNGVSPVPFWTEVGFFPGLVVMLYGLTAHALWFSPIYGWLLLISAWARRAPLLWAVLPLLAVAAVERILLQATPFASMLKYRLGGAMVVAFDFSKKPARNGNIEELSQLDPARFLTTPGLWIGLIFAAACLAAAIHLRRNREPI